MIVVTSIGGGGVAVPTTVFPILRVFLRTAVLFLHLHILFLKPLDQWRAY